MSFGHHSQVRRKGSSAYGPPCRREPERRRSYLASTVVHACGRPGREAKAQIAAHGRLAASRDKKEKNLPEIRKVPIWNEIRHPPWHARALTQPVDGILPWDLVSRSIGRVEAYEGAGRGPLVVQPCIGRPGVSSWVCLPTACVQACTVCGPEPRGLRGVGTKDRVVHLPFVWQWFLRGGVLVLRDECTDRSSRWKSQAGNKGLWPLRTGMRCSSCRKPHSSLVASCPRTDRSVSRRHSAQPETTTKLSGDWGTVSVVMRPVAGISRPARGDSTGVPPPPEGMREREAVRALLCCVVLDGWYVHPHRYYVFPVL